MAAGVAMDLQFDGGGRARPYAVELQAVPRGIQLSFDRDVHWVAVERAGAASGAIGCVRSAAGEI